ncbi:ATP-binding protein [Nostoc sp. CHAB 5836]|uniref:ATP-binding protein n=1 Tax=Nostoc sp. CHAB 5836 TaxID=2780404 RepID=UPI001E50809E|nr:ATP-binding protein [Nostoc sp. CHAB 5836]MCC5618418.1 ATP-binding protein [Nostoc sp. CHAB 5836]
MFKPATKSNLKIRLALSGSAGSGKTYSSLAIASNISQKIAVIDTERGSASRYADLFQFDVCELDSHHPAKYIEAIIAAEANGYEVIIIDSLSHAWYAELELAGTNRGGGTSFDGWKNVRPLERKLLDAIVSSRCHIIVTMRSKTEWDTTQRDSNGKMKPTKIGTAPIQTSGIEYEFDIAGELSAEHILYISKSRCPELQDTSWLKPGVELAQALKNWMSTAPIRLSSAPIVAAVHPQDLRVKQIRTLLDYPVDLVKEWLQFQDVKTPSQLEVTKVDELVKVMCLAWASDKIDHPNHAQNSYAKHVVDAVVKGGEEVVTIQNWMQHIQSPHQASVKA